MSSAFYRLLLALVVLGAAAPYGYERHRSQQSRPAQPAAPSASTNKPARTPNDAPAPWWRDEQFRKEIGLKDDQADQVGKLWDETSRTLRQKIEEFEEAQRELDAQIAKNSPISKVSNQIRLVEMARADMTTTRQIMLYKMRSILKPAQRTKFDEIHPRWRIEFDRRMAEWQTRRAAEQKRPSDAKPSPKSEPRKPF